MSYILDALRKADAQRESDPARGIHAQPVRVAVGETRASEGSRIGLWSASAAAVAVLAFAGWYSYRDRGAVAVAPPVATEVVAAAPAMADPPPPPAAVVLPPPVPAPAPVVAAPAVATPPVVRAPSAGTPAAAVTQPPSRAGGTARKARLAAAAQAEDSSPSTPAAGPAAAPAVAAPPAGVPGPAVAAAAPVAPAAPTAPTAPVATVAPVVGLPADAPKLAISGGVYSANAAQRMLIVNGQVFSEGVEVGPGVTLEEIKPKTAVLKFRGSRYTVTY